KRRTEPSKGAPRNVDHDLQLLRRFLRWATPAHYLAQELNAGKGQARRVATPAVPFHILPICFCISNGFTTFGSTFGETDVMKLRLLLRRVARQCKCKRDVNMAANIVAYLRVSTERQGKSGLGLEGQRAALEGYAEQTGGKIVAWYTEVESGKRADRP